MIDAQPIPLDKRVEFNEDKFNDAILSIEGDPNCKMGGCHGKGYIGIKVNPDGSRVIILCRCGRWMETDYIKLSKQISKIEENLSINDHLIMRHVDNRTLAGFTVNLYRKIIKRINRNGRKAKENTGS